MSETIEATADRRVRLVLDETPQNPREDGDYHLAGVVTVYGDRYIDVADPAGESQVQYAARYWLNKYDWRHAERLIERYVRLLGGVSEIDTPHDGPRSLWYVLPGKWIETTRTPWNADEARRAIETERDEYRSWAEGDVYGYIVEERKHWTSGDDEMDTWELVDSCWGFIGREYAEEAAREAFAN